jgi:hypothetical protein
VRRAVLVAIAIVVLVTVALAVSVGPSEAWGRHSFRTHVFVGVGPVWWGPAYPYWWGPGYYPYWRYYPPAYYPPAYYAPPPVVVPESPVYVEPPPAAAQAPAPATPTKNYWYYCKSSGAYYPNVPSCPESWIKVPPRPE